MSDPIRAEYDQLALLPVRLEDWLPADHPARFVREFVASLDLPALGFGQAVPGPGRPGYAAELLLAVWLYGYLRRIRSTRALELACQDNLGMLWLTGQHAPDHSTLWQFFRDNRAALRRLFRHVVQVAVACELVGLALHALDGTKLAACGSRHTAWHRKDLQRALAKAAAAEAEAAVTAIEAAEGEEPGAVRWALPLTDRGAQQLAIQAALAALDAAETDVLHPGEPEARLMKGGDGEILLGYNAQAVVDAQSGLIVAADIVTAASDAHQLPPMLAEVCETVGQPAAVTVADGGFFSGAALSEAEARGATVLVSLPELPDNPYDKSRFAYDAETDSYLCPRGERLPFASTKFRRARGYRVRIYRCRCRDCPARAQCSTDAQGRTIMRTPHDGAIERQRAAQQGAEARGQLRQRGGIVERIFAEIKQTLGFRRFTVWGLAAVRAQWLLLCLTLNLRRCYARWRLGAALAA